ncbi:hypothetical protein [Sphingomonas sp. SUN039]|uniref:hypothetical protein n=1 Tax=Sphingomonas sp. SUN039 TaxID=2937787 RepID=UPI0021648849|nr:hypothetical protein [Sphingomonas sp. SUN039]UVO53543.1 hypothetical protein M0209_05195 [Sphingomonas sp. SUN039]
MRFSLTFQGDLPPRGSPSQIQNVRAQFDPQMRRLWNTEPLIGSAKFIDPLYMPNDCYVPRRIKDTEYVPLVSDKLALRASLSVTLYSSDLPGGMLSHGDIDNRMKTLLDALTIPPIQQAPNLSTNDGRTFCLLDDDRLVSELAIRNERLLTVEVGNRQSLAIIDVKLIAARALMCNVGIVF